MSGLDQRLQVLIDEPRLQRVRDAAQREGVPVGLWVRNLIDKSLGAETQAEKIRAFMDYVASLPPADFGGDSVEDVRAAREARTDRLLALDEEAHPSVGAD